MTATIVYKGSLRCEATHTQSCSVIQTDAPTDNRGKGENFSPTDLLCVSLGTCIATTMGIRAADMGIDLSGAKIAVVKHMLTEPRRIGKIEVKFQLPITNTTEDNRKILQKIGDTCPVTKSLHPDMDLSVSYNWV